MQKATHISSFMFNYQLSTKSECSALVLIESSLTVPSSAKASYVSTSSSTGPGGKVACKRDVSLVRPSPCTLKGGIPRCQRHLPTLQEEIHVNLRFPFVVQPHIVMSSDAASLRAFDDEGAETHRALNRTHRVRQRMQQFSAMYTLSAGRRRRTKNVLK